MRNPPSPTDPHITVVVEGVADAAVRAAIRDAVETVLHTAQVRGAWLIAVAPSETRGRWDLAVKGPAGRHVTYFAAALTDVAAVAAQHVARHLATATTAGPDPTHRPSRPGGRSGR